MQGPQVLYFLFKFLVTPYHFKTSRPFQNLPCNKLLVSPCFFRMSADGINQIIHICSSNEKRKSVQRFFMCRTFFSCRYTVYIIYFTRSACSCSIPTAAAAALLLSTAATLQSQLHTYRQLLLHTYPTCHTTRYPLCPVWQY